MTKQDIKNDYAIKHNFSSWKELYLSFYWVDNYEGFLVHENAVIDLIQNECLKNASESALEFENISDNDDCNYVGWKIQDAIKKEKNILK